LLRRLRKNDLLFVHEGTRRNVEKGDDMSKEMDLIVELNTLVVALISRFFGLENRIDGLGDCVSGMGVDGDKLEERVSGLENQAKSLEERVSVFERPVIVDSEGQKCLEYKQLKRVVWDFKELLLQVEKRVTGLEMEKRMEVEQPEKKGGGEDE
jgi:hypothetical protein